MTRGSAIVYTVYELWISGFRVNRQTKSTDGAGVVSIDREAPHVTL